MLRGRVAEMRERCAQRGLPAVGRHRTLYDQASPHWQPSRRVLTERCRPIVAGAGVSRAGDVNMAYGARRRNRRLGHARTALARGLRTERATIVPTAERERGSSIVGSMISSHRPHTLMNWSRRGGMGLSCHRLKSIHIGYRPAFVVYRHRSTATGATRCAA